jgi:hypothetical protein
VDEASQSPSDGSKLAADSFASTKPALQTDTSHCIEPTEAKECCSQSFFGADHINYFFWATASAEDGSPPAPLVMSGT